MQARFERIIKCIEDYDNNKAEIQHYLLELDPFLSEHFPFIEEKEPFNLFKKTTEERLKESQNKLENASTNKVLILPENLEKINNNLRSIVKSVPLGFISNFELANGLFQVKITCLITTSAYSSNETEEEQKERYRKSLTAHKIDFIENKNSPIKLPTTENNFNRIKNFLASKEAKMISIKTMDDHIDSISFFIRPCDIGNFEEVEIDTTPTFQNGLTTVQIKNVQKACRELLSSASNYNLVPDSCSYIIHSLFTEISEICNVETSISKEFRNRNIKERQMNFEIEENNKKINSLLDGNNIKSAYEELTDFLDKEITQKTGLGIKNFKMRPHNTSFEIYYSESISLFCSNAPSQETIMSMFDIEKFYREFKMKFNDKNISKIEEIVKSVNGEIDEINIYCSEGMKFIKSVQVNMK